MIGPSIGGDAIDIFDDLVLTGSNRNKEVIQLFSLSHRALVATIDWDLRGDIETGYVYAARFTKPYPQIIVAGGAGKNEVKFFENNVDSSNNFRTLCHIDSDSAILSMDTSKNGDSVAFGQQDGKISVISCKLEEGEHETYKGGIVRTYQDKKGELKMRDEEEEHKV